MSKSVKKFLAQIGIETKEKKVELKLVDKPLVSYPYDPDGKYAGYFSIEPELMVCVAVGRPQKKWLPILVHEYCHFCQWSEDSKVWNDNFHDDHEGRDGEDILGRWMNGKIALGKEKIERCAKTTIEVELDAEKRGIKVIDKFNLPIDKEEYIQKANASLMYYSLLLKKKKWFDISPFEIEELYSQLPNFFLNDYMNINEKYHKLYEKFCFRKADEN